MDDYKANPKTATIVEATVALLNSEGPSVATARIAKAAGVSNGSMFNLLPNKQAILDETYLALKHQMLTAAKMPSDAYDEGYFRALWSGYVHWGMANRARHAAMTLLFHSDLVGDAAKAQVDAWLTPIIMQMATRLQSGAYRIQDAKIYSSMMLALMDHVIANDFTTEQQEQVFHLFWFGNLTNG